MTIKDLPLKQRIEYIKTFVACVTDWEEMCKSLDSSCMPSGEQSIFWYKALGIMEALMIQCDNSCHALNEFMDKFQEMNEDWQNPLWNARDMLIVLLGAFGADKELFDAFSTELGCKE